MVGYIGIRQDNDVKATDLYRLDALHNPPPPPVRPSVMGVEGPYE